MILLIGIKFNFFDALTIALAHEPNVVDKEFVLLLGCPNFGNLK